MYDYEDTRTLGSVYDGINDYDEEMMMKANSGCFI